MRMRTAGKTKNFKCPYCNQELISQDNLIKQMRNIHSMVILLYNFILINTIINYICSHLFFVKLQIKT